MKKQVNITIPNGKKSITKVFYCKPDFLKKIDGLAAAANRTRHNYLLDLLYQRYGKDNGFFRKLNSEKLRAGLSWSKFFIKTFHEQITSRGVVK